MEWIVVIFIVLLVLGWLGQRNSATVSAPQAGGSRSDGASQPSYSGITINYGSRGRRAALGPDEAADGDRLWQPPGEAVALQGSLIKADMVYVGSGLPALHGDGAEPALIDPRLKVDTTRIDWTGNGLDYWPSYSTIPPPSRAAYLAWLGRDRPPEPIPLGYVFLFFYGLERRVLLDARHLATAAAEVPLIRREVARLLSAFGDNRSFGSYASEFLGAIDVLFPDPDAPIAVPAEKSWELPLDLRLRLGRLVAAGEPIGAELALAWALSAPDIYLRTPATRCADEFAALFLARYRQRHGDGLVIKEPRRRLELHYRPASASFGGPLKLPTGDLPDVSGLTAPVARLRELVDECTDELDAYSRWLGRNRAPSAVVAAALLPTEAIDARGGGAIEGLRARLEERLGDAPMTTIDADELLRLWPETRESKLDKSGAVLLAQLLDRLGLGIEPDVRFGGPIFDAGGAAVLFRRGHEPSAAPSAAYTSATVIARLGMAIASADGTVSEEEIAGIEAQLSRVLDLSATERTRLAAHLHWLRSARPALTGLKKRLADLSTAQRGELGSFLIAVAGADGYIGPNEVAALGRLYGILGLDPQSVFSRVHAYDAGGGAASPAPAPGTDAGGVTLDMDRVRATLQKTHAVSALLSDVFVDAEPEVFEAPRSDLGIAGLDSAHSELLLRLRGRAAIPRAAFDDEARRLRLLPDGALDTINDAAFDQVGMAIVVGADPLEVDSEALEEMLA